jgi:EAL domain-containing protein (putative c-di-GMP-specific phosphodiesterase class I)
MIDTLTRVLLEKAFTAQVFKTSALKLAVNITPGQLLSLNLPERLAEIAAKAGFALDRLTIEITESALVDDLERVQAVAGSLKALKCNLALDDFGTGYSSLKHLHILPFDKLKIDRSFVATMTRQRESRKIVATVVGLGQSLGLTTVAEGVETQEQADMLLWLCADQAQGWLYGKPVSAGDLDRVVAEISGHPRRQSRLCLKTQVSARMPCPPSAWRNYRLSMTALP